MGLRTFSDSAGNSWRVWHVESPAASAHLIDASFRDGWLAFEREDGSERRRLVQTPEDWESLPAERLSSLLQSATRVDLSRTGTTPQRVPAIPRDDDAGSAASR